MVLTSPSAGGPVLSAGDASSVFLRGSYSPGPSDARTNIGIRSLESGATLVFYFEGMDVPEVPITLPPDTYVQGYPSTFLSEPTVHGGPPIPQTFLNFRVTQGSAIVLLSTVENDKNIPHLRLAQPLARP